MNGKGDFIEEWRDVVGYEGLYLVSNMGQIKNVDNTSKWYGKILKQHLQSSGFYMQAYLIKDGNRRQLLVHKIVAQAFIPNSYNLPQVNHKDEDKTNNRATNLEWCTAQHNANHGTRNNKIRNGGFPVCEYGLDGNLIRTWKNSVYIEEIYGCAARTIHDSLSGVSKHFRGHMFRKYSETYGSKIKAFDYNSMSQYYIDKMSEYNLDSIEVPSYCIYNPESNKEYIGNILNYLSELNESDKITYKLQVALEHIYTNTLHGLYS